MRTWTFIQPIFLSIYLLLGTVGCKNTLAHDSYLVIAVDQLGYNSIDCSKEPKVVSSLSGFEVLCRDFSRWSHAYTPSTLAAPALTSMLTGEYPVNHGVRNNGGNYLSANFETVAETAYRRGWSTLFISGGAPILRKTGLGQGFEIFDDTLKPNLELLHRPFQQTVQIFFSHLKEIGKQASMAWIYVPDLLFDKLPTKNSLGEPRNLSYDSQLEQFDDELTKFFEQLKVQNRWNNTTIIVVGLNSHPKGVHRKTLNQNNLYSESTQVALFIKWAGTSPRATYDENISLVDIGTTLFERISGPAKESTTGEFPSYSLLTASNQNRPIEDRWIVLESAWSSWHFHTDIFKAYRNGPFLCLQEDSLKCYNSHLDRDELLPLSKVETSKMQFSPTIQKYFTEYTQPKTEALFNPQPTPIDHPCYQLIKNSRFLPSEMRRCEDSAVLDLAQWMYDEQNPLSEISQKESAKRKFAKTLWYSILDQRIDEVNSSLGKIWDISEEKTTKRNLFDAILELPEVNKYRTQAQRTFLIMRDEPERN